MKIEMDRLPEDQFNYKLKSRRDSVEDHKQDAKIPVC